MYDSYTRLASLKIYLDACVDACLGGVAAFAADGVLLLTAFSLHVLCRVRCCFPWELAVVRVGVQLEGCGGPGGNGPSFDEPGAGDGLFVRVSRPPAWTLNTEASKKTVGVVVVRNQAFGGVTILQMTS